MQSESCHIVTIGGGSGQYALLSGLRDMAGVKVSAVVSMVDSGGSTGRLRDELGTLPPGDILKCILALSPNRDIMRRILQRRFKTDRRLRGHNAGNMLLTMLSRYTGSFPSGIQALAEILDVRGTVLPVSIDKATLVAELTDKSRVYGESAIDMPRGTQREKIRDVFLVPHIGDTVSVYPPVLRAIRTADFIIMGPGDLYTSIIPNLIVPGVKEALMKTTAPLVYVANIMTKYGETHNFMASDFITRLEALTGRPIDIVIYNDKAPSPHLMKLYEKQKAEYVTIDCSNKIWDCYRIHAADLLETSGDIIRHDSGKLANLIRRALINGDAQ